MSSLTLSTEKKTVDDVLKSLERAQFSKKKVQQRKPGNTTSLPVITTSQWQQLEKARLTEEEKQKLKEKKQQERLAKKEDREKKKRELEKKRKDEPLTRKKLMRKRSLILKDSNSENVDDDLLPEDESKKPVKRSRNKTGLGRSVLIDLCANNKFTGGIKSSLYFVIF